MVVVIALKRRSSCRSGHKVLLTVAFMVSVLRAGSCTGKESVMQDRLLGGEWSCSRAGMQHAELHAQDWACTQQVTGQFEFIECFQQPTRVGNIAL